MKDQLTPKMIEVIEHMKRHNNKIVRYPGGYWASEDWHMWQGPCFGTPTVEAIIRRGYAKYTVWREGKSGNKFPIEAELISPKETEAHP